MTALDYTPKDVERFWSKVDRTEEHTDCWVWTAGRHTNGYGWIYWRKTRLTAHRVSYALAFGAIPDGLHVCHHCDNPSCVKPQHLFLGTNLDNIHDRMRKGRSKGPGLGGEKNPSSKLSDAQVQEIRQRYADGERGTTALGKEYGVSRNHIWNLVTGKFRR